jgi:hypothetical protein
MQWLSLALHRDFVLALEGKAMSDDTIFRFITVRGPRKPTEQEAETAFVVYEDKIGSDIVEAYRRFDASHAAEVALRYKQSQDFPTTPAQIEERQKGLVTTGDWLRAEASRLTQPQLKIFLATVPIAPEAGILTWLWDNLATHVLVGGRAEARESIINALRVYKLIGSPGLEARSDAELRRMAAATVLMPSRRGAPSEPPTDDGGATNLPPPDEKPAERAAKGFEQIAVVQRTADALTDQLQQQIDRGRVSAPKALLTPKVTDGCTENVAIDAAQEAANAAIAHEATLLSAERIGRLGDEAQAVLRQAGVEAGARVPYALQRLRLHAQGIAQSTMAGITAEQPVIAAGGAFWVAASSTEHDHPAPVSPVRQEEFYGDFYVNERRCKIHPLGIADYRRVEQRLFCYEAGEIAHIENVMQGETKERTTRNLRRTEDIITVSTQEDTTTERETQTTDRFEITREASKVVQDDIKLDLGVNVQADYGTVKITADTKFAIAHSSTESDKQASKYGRDVTERALDRVVKSVREERVSKVISEYEEINKHGLKGGDDKHVVGLYRWVDKIYEARVVNYGKRLMFEFMVPEPAAFHLYATFKNPVESTTTLKKPVDPRSPDLLAAIGLAPLTSYSSVTETNYGLYAAAYEAKVDPPPSLWQTVSKAYNREGMDQAVQFSDSKNDLKLPVGYEAVSFVAPYGFHSGGPNWVTIAVGGQSTFATSGGTFSSVLDGEDDIVPLVIMGRTRFYALNIEILCKLTTPAYEAWKLKVFNAIVDAYNTKLAAYNNDLAAAKSRVGIEIQGSNPATNRLRERVELEKSCLRLLSQHCDPLWSNAMKDNRECKYPEFDCCEAIRDGSYVQFLEQCFEWKLMTYLFFPYLWGRKCNWQKIYQLDDADPLFLAFLQAGFARVVVPVTPGYKDAALRFLADGTLWDGGAIPGVDDPLYRSIVVEMMEEVGTIDPDIKPWTIKVPTTLTVLQCESGCVPGSGLPCPGPATPWPPG